MCSLRFAKVRVAKVCLFLLASCCGLQPLLPLPCPCCNAHREKFVRERFKLLP